MRSALLVLLVAALLPGCVGHPLGSDWEQLAPEARDERALEVLTQLIAGGVDGGGTAFTDRNVLESDLARVRYVPLDEPEAKPSVLRWGAIQSVEGQPLTTLPARPETLFVYLSEGVGVQDKVTPILARAGLAQPYLLLRSRPRWSRTRMVLALEHLRGRASVAPVSSGEPATPREPTPSEPTPSEPTAAEPEPPPGEPPPADPSPAEPGPSPADPAPREDLDSIEAKLERLRKWREEGLIDEAEYQAKRQELLKRL